MDQIFNQLTKEIAEKAVAAVKSTDVQAVITNTKSAKAEDSGSFEVIISTSNEDRMGDIVDQTGWDLTFYKQNPIVLWAHDYSMLPIGVCDDVAVQNGQLVAKGHFAPEDANPFAQQVRKLYELKMVRATSVGFIAKEMVGNVITQAELLEFSFVPVPANPYALSLEKAKEMGIDVEMLKTKGFEFKTATEAAPAEEEKKEEEKQEEKKEEGKTEPSEEQKSIETKAGRVLSEKNMSIVKQAIAALQQLLDAAESQGDDEQKTVKTEEAQKQRSSDVGFDEWLYTRQVLRAINNATSEALGSFNKKLKKQK